ncbi:hypothetical protein IJS77_05440 [bacterium]|nr:hypothetical protein [bacterium]
MKKIIATFLVIMFMGIGLNVQAATFKTAIAKYKAGNFTGCINDLDEVAERIWGDKENSKSIEKLAKIVSKYDYQKWKDGNAKDGAEARKMLLEIQKEVPRSSLDKWSYLFYYYALCLHQLGYKNEAKYFYKAAGAFTWESKSQIFKYSMQGLTCIEKPESCKGSDMDDFIKSGKQVSDEIIREELKRNLQKHQDEINKGKDLSFVTPVNDKLAWVDTGINPDIANQFSETSIKETNDMPTDEEIGKAFRTLQRAGINPTFNVSDINNEYAQYSSLLNDDNNGYYNDYSTMMMMNGQNKQQITPQMMQAIMQQQMMGGLGF